jgi:hypothetical protein
MAFRAVRFVVSVVDAHRIRIGLWTSDLIYDSSRRARIYYNSLLCCCVKSL